MRQSWAVRERAAQAAREASPVGALRWRQAKLVDHKQSSWYDHSWVDVEVVGKADLGRITSALMARFPNTGNYFGGYTTIGTVQEVVTVLQPGTSAVVRVETVYHVGN